MTTFPSTTSWIPIDLPVLSSIERSTYATEISRDNWPNWTAGSTQFNRIIFYSRPKIKTQNSSLLSASLNALLTERIDLKDFPKIYNYNMYVVAETTDGKLFQSPPIKPTDPKHHSSKPSTWFEKLGSPV